MTNQIETNLFEEELTDADLMAVVGGDAILDNVLKYVDVTYKGLDDYFTKDKPILQTEKFVTGTVKEVA
ncbi:MAG: hypothetical protein PUP91_24040 [Rhizonema sp. PD37]|nr:hypothetical protein [Rhizonema sp. PD37]